MVRAILILSALFALTSCVATRPSSSASEGEVREASDRFRDARLRGDAVALAEQFTDDGILMVPGVPDATGRVAVRELLKEMFASVRIEDLEVRSQEIQVIGDVAYELAWYSEVNVRKDGSYRFEGRYLIVWKREAGKGWRVHRNLYNFSDATPVG